MERIYPFVRSIRQPDALSAGPWLQGKPIGVTLHYTADRSVDNVARHTAKTKIGYHLLIDRLGFIHQTAYLDERVNHAGKAMWRGMSPNKNHLAVGLLSWGELVEQDGEIRTWTGIALPQNQVVKRLSAFGKVAWWDAATPDQEAALMKFFWWALTTCHIDPRDVCGHDECALPPGRKVDPGGVLSSSMMKLRDRLSASA